MDKKQNVLNLINSIKFYNDLALDALCKEKVFVMVCDNRIVFCTRTRKGAEFFSEQWEKFTLGNTYYDYYTKDYIQADHPLEFIEILASEIRLKEVVGW